VGLESNRPSALNLDKPPPLSCAARLATFGSAPCMSFGLGPDAFIFEAYPPTLLRLHYGRIRIRLRLDAGNEMIRAHFCKFPLRTCQVTVSAGSLMRSVDTGAEVRA
jgi:hypothetical protein